MKGWDFIMARTIMVVGRGTSVARLSYDGKKNTYKATEFQAVVDSNVQGCTRINCLAVVVHTMTQLRDTVKIQDTNEVANIFTVGLVSDMVHRGTFKHWLNGEGKKLDGSEVSETEMNLWREFTELYKDLFMNVNIRNISDTSIPEKSKFKVSAEQKALNQLTAKVWEMVKDEEPAQEQDVEGL